MAEIIKFPGGGKSPKKPEETKQEEPQVGASDQMSLWNMTVAEEAQATSPGSRSAEQIKADSKWINNPDNDHAKALFKRQILRINEFINSLKGYTPTKGDVRIRRAGFKDMHVSELMDIAAVSKEAYWQQHPSYFIALRIEINDRAMRAKEDKN